MAEDGVRHVSDDERRARIAARHGIAPAARHADPVAATEAMTVLHATEPATVYLSLRARVDDLTVADVDRALYEERSLVKQLAMRRTVFVFPRDLLPAAWGSTSARVAAQLRPRLAKDVEAGGIADDGAAWVDRACAAVLARLADGSELSAKSLREAAARARGPHRPCGRQDLRRQRRDLPAGADPARRRGAGHPGPQRRALAGVPPAVDVHGGLVGRRTRAVAGDRGLGRDGAPLAVDVRARHRRRHPVVAGWHGRHRQAGADRRRCRAGLPRRDVDGDPGWLLPDDLEPVTHAGLVGRAAARARPDGDGLEVTRLLPRRRSRAAPVRHQRQRRHHGVGRRTRGGLLGAGRRRRRRGPLRRRRCRSPPSVPSPWRRPG